MSASAAALLALLCAAQDPRPIAVRVLTRDHPTTAQVRGPRSVVVELAAGRLLVDGKPAERLALPRAVWTVLLPRKPARALEGALAVRAEGPELSFVLAMPLEAYVAEAVSSEMAYTAPREALRAQAIVSRSYALAGPRRHPDADVCDLAHCQALGLAASPEHRRAAREAARSTAGLVLRLASGAIARAPFHSACGGHTADPRELFGGEDGTGAAAVADPGCVARWEAQVPASSFAEVTARLLGAHTGAAELRLERGAGGFAARVVARGTGRAASGDALARALDEALGWGQVRSSRLTLERMDGGDVRVRGSGFGHGVGLCQAGAVRMAREGANAEEILRRFFPRAWVLGAGSPPLRP
jgi:stage II sporulation protein D